MAGSVTNSYAAPDIKIIFNQQTVGIANEISFTVDYSNSVQGELDNIMAREFVPGMFKASGRLAGVLIRSTSLEQAGFFSAAGANLIQPYISLQILDRRSDQLIYSFPSAIISDVSVSARSASIVLFDCSFLSFGVLTSQSQLLPSVPFYAGVPPTDKNG